MKAYIVNNYVTNEIDQIFSDGHRAELYCADHAGCEIEVREVDTEKVEEGEIHYGIVGFFYMSEDKVMDTWQKYSREPIGEMVEIDARGTLITLPTDGVRSENERRQILNECMAKLRGCKNE